MMWKLEIIFNIIITAVSGYVCLYTYDMVQVPLIEYMIYGVCTYSSISAMSNSLIAYKNRWYG